MLFGKLSNKYMRTMCSTPDALGGLFGSLSMRKRAGATAVDMIARTINCPRTLSATEQ